MLSFVGGGMCTSVSADQRSEALGARNAGECRLAQDGLEKDDAVFGVEDCYGDQGEDEESSERAAEHFEEPGPLVERCVRLPCQKQGNFRRQGSNRAQIGPTWTRATQAVLRRRSREKTSFSGLLSLFF